MIDFGLGCRGGQILSVSGVLTEIKFTMKSGLKSMKHTILKLNQNELISAWPVKQRHHCDRRALWQLLAQMDHQSRQLCIFSLLAFLLGTLVLLRANKVPFREAQENLRRYP